MTARLVAILFRHEIEACLTELETGGGVNGVVDAGVAGHETAEQLRVGGVDDGVEFQAGDIALPQSDIFFDGRDFFQGDDALFDRLRAEQLILHGEESGSERHGRSDIHEGAEQLSTVADFFRRRAKFGHFVQ